MTRHFFLLAFIVLMPTIEAAEFFSHSIERTAYAPGETVQVELVFLREPLVSLTAEQLSLRDSDDSVIRTAFFLRKVKDTVFISFDLPLTSAEGNVTLIFSQVLFRDRNLTQRVDYRIHFTIEHHVPTLAVFPSVIVPGAEKEFTLKTKTYDHAVDLNITTSSGILNIYTTRQELLPNRERTFKFYYKEAHERKETVVLQYGVYRYVVPVLFASDLPRQGTTNLSTPTIEIISTLKAIERELDSGEVILGSLDIRNSGDVDAPLHVDVIGVADFVTVDAPELLVKNSTASLTVTVDSTHVREGLYEGEIILSSGGYVQKVPVKVTVRAAQVEPLIGPPEPEPKEPPKEDDLFTFNLSSYEATEREERSRIGLVVFLFLLLLVAIAIYLFSRRTTRKKSFEEYVGKLEKK